MIMANSMLQRLSLIVLRTGEFCGDGLTNHVFRMMMSTREGMVWITGNYIIIIISVSLLQACGQRNKVKQRPLINIYNSIELASNNLIFGRLKLFLNYAFSWPSGQSSLSHSDTFLELILQGFLGVFG